MAMLQVPGALLCAMCIAHVAVLGAPACVPGFSPSFEACARKSVLRLHGCCWRPSWRDLAQNCPPAPKTCMSCPLRPSQLWRSIASHGTLYPHGSSALQPSKASCGQICCRCLVWWCTLVCLHGHSRCSMVAGVSSALLVGRPDCPMKDKRCHPLADPISCPNSCSRA